MENKFFEYISTNTMGINRLIIIISFQWYDFIINMMVLINGIVFSINLTKERREGRGFDRICDQLELFSISKERFGQREVLVGEEQWNHDRV